jgi:hypothetical protein
MPDRRSGKRSRSVERRDRRARDAAAELLRKPDLAGLWLRLWRNDPPTSPLDAEMIASHLVGTLVDRVSLVARADALSELVDDIAGQRTRVARDLLIALSSVVPDDLAAHARALTAGTGEASRPAPIWVGGIGRAVFRNARSATDQFGDQDLLLATFEHPGWRPHAFVITVDHNLRGLFKQAGVTLDEDSIAQQWEETTGLRLQPISSEELAARWQAAIRTYHSSLDPPVGDGVAELMPLIEARARALPHVSDRDEERTEPSDAEVEALIAEVLSSPHGASLTANRDEAGVALRAIVEYRSNHADGDLWRWSPTVVELGLVDWIPRKSLLEEAEIAILPDALRAVVRVAAERKGLEEADVAMSLAEIDRQEPAYRAAMADGSMQGPATLVARLMRDDGVELTDPDSVERWLTGFNARPRSERDALIGPAVDRFAERSKRDTQPAQRDRLSRRLGGS